ncbi:MAG TPA: DUF4136 domain-containing protein [Pyrinomonadaceae bacterium]|nr:DUF4136 domain-containing protein [Pyrinomonadaceae bacterium]
MRVVSSRRNLALMIVIVLGGALSANAQKVNVGADPRVNLTTYKTYQWDQGSAGANPVVTQLIIAAVDAQMAAKGVTKVETDPDLLLSAFAWTESDMQMSYPSWSPSLNSIATGVVVNTQSWVVTKGTLVVSMADAKNKSEVWRGTASDTMKHGPTADKAKDAKTAEKPIKKAVEKMFKQFPVKK